MLPDLKVAFLRNCLESAKNMSKTQVKLLADGARKAVTSSSVSPDAKIKKAADALLEYVQQKQEGS